MEKKTINLNKTIYELCSEYPDLPELLAKIGFKDITKPGMIATAGRFMTIPKGAAMKKIDLAVIEQTLADHGFEINGK
jgi:selenophosphate synthetase-related protein